jgi:phosphate transport system permease protein
MPVPPPSSDGTAVLAPDQPTRLETEPSSAGIPIPSRRRWSGDRLFVALTASFGALVLLIPGAMFLALGKTALPAFERFGWRFVVSSIWDPVNGQFGALPFIWGTVVSSLLAVLLAVPVSLGVAIYLAELAPRWLRRPLTTLVELLAAPSPASSTASGRWPFWSPS